MKKLLLLLIMFFCVVPELSARTYIKTGTEVVPSYESKEKIIGFLKQKLTKEAISEEGTFIFGTLEIREDTLSNNPEVEEELTKIIGSFAKVIMIGGPETSYIESGGYKAECIKITLKIDIDRGSAKKQVDLFVNEYIKGKLANRQYKNEIELLKQKNELLEKNRIEAEKLSKEISSLKQKQNQYSQNKNYSRYSEPVKWELSGYYFQPSFADEPIGYYGNDVAAATVKAACGGTFSYSLWPWFAVGAGYENVANTSRTHSGNGHYTYKGWMFRMKLTLNPSNTFRIYLPIFVGRYKYKLQYEDTYYEYVNYQSYWHYYSRNEERTKTVITGGGGIEIGLSHNVALAGEFLFPLHQGGSPGKLKHQINARLNYRW